MAQLIQASILVFAISLSTTHLQAVGKEKEALDGGEKKPATTVAKSFDQERSRFRTDIETAKKRLDNLDERVCAYVAENRRLSRELEEIAQWGGDINLSFFSDNSDADSERSEEQD